jgi:hypothetical protein
MSTKSEALLEQFCSTNHLPLFRCVNPHHGETKRTADYVVVLKGHAIVVEVKQLESNPEEKQFLADSMRGDTAHFLTTIPGSRVRDMIESARVQLKNTSIGILPTLLVLFDNSSIPLNHLAPYEILTGMYGVEQVVIGVPRQPSSPPFVLGEKHGPNQGVTRTQNTTISCVSVLWQDNQADLKLEVYHNDFATNEIDPDWFRIDPCRHWKRRDSERDSSFRGWVQI